jgi:hypothetical protein
MIRGNVTTRAQLTARLLLGTALGAAEYINFGNLTGHKITTKRESSVVTKAGKGFHQEAIELPALVGLRYEFTLDEEFGRTNELHIFGKQGSDSIESSVVRAGRDRDIHAVKLGYSYVIPKHNLNTVVVKVSSVTKVQDVDYTIDLGSGELTVIAGGGIAAGDNLAVTFGSTGSTFEATALSTSASATRADEAVRVRFSHDAKGLPFREWASSDVQYWIAGDESMTGRNRPRGC